MELILSALPSDGSWVEFSTFISAVRIAGGRAELWRRAKQAGLLETQVVGNYAETGLLQVRKVVS